MNAFCSFTYGQVFVARGMFTRAVEALFFFRGAFCTSVCIARAFSASRGLSFTFLFRVSVFQTVLTHHWAGSERIYHRVGDLPRDVDRIWEALLVESNDVWVDFWLSRLDEVSLFNAFNLELLFLQVFFKFLQVLDFELSEVDKAFTGIESWMGSDDTPIYLQSINCLAFFGLGFAAGL